MIYMAILMKIDEEFFPSWRRNSFLRGITGHFHNIKFFLLRTVHSNYIELASSNDLLKIGKWIKIC